jgi:hypothetical protein
MMNSFGKILLLLLINILVSVSATLAVLYYWENIHNAEKPYTLITSEEIEKTEQKASSPEIDYAIVSTSTSPLTTLTVEITDSIEQSDISSTEESMDEIAPVRGSLVFIPQAIGIGDVSLEAVRIESNTDDAVSLAGWTLEDSEGNIFSFPNIQMIRKGFFLEVYSRSGHDTPYELYWGRSVAVWQSGETIELKDAKGQLQSTYRIP